MKSEAAPLTSVIAGAGLILSFAFPQWAALAAAQSAGTSSEVQTLAGSGLAGISDGPVGTAKFLLPVGIAIAADGSIFVADQGAQRIRKIAAGKVTTVAGSGALDPDGLWVPGGYRDGLATKAQLNWPSGLAIGPDHALYIADSKNQSIRKLDRGMLSTVVGKAGENRARDGNARTGRFAEPRALAFDARGNLYVADNYGGLRRFGTDGRLTTIPLKATLETDFIGIAIDRAGDGTILLSTPDQIVSYQPSTGASQAFRATIAEGDRIFGEPDALFALNHREFLFTDPWSHTLRYLRLPAAPYVNSIFTRTIAGGPAERWSDNAGFRNGRREDARFFAPAGLDVAHGYAYVTDAGGRRIRKIKLPRTMASAAGVNDSIPTDDKHFDIAYIGASSSYYDSLGPDDSICGRIADDLNAARITALPVRCHPIRIDAVTMASMGQYIANFLAPQNYKIIIVQSSPESEFQSHPAVLATILQGMLDALRPTNTKLILAWAYAANELNGSENFFPRERDTPFRELPYLGYLFNQRSVLPLLSTGKALNIPQYDLYRDLINFQFAATSRPMFNTTGEDHITRYGNVAWGKLIATFLRSLPTSETGFAK